MLTTAATATAAVIIVTEQQCPRCVGHDVTPVERGIPAALSVIVRLHVVELQRLGCRDESGGGGYLQPAHAERKFNACFGRRIAGMSASSIDVFRVANGISVG